MTLPFDVSTLFTLSGTVVLLIALLLVARLYYHESKAREAAERDPKNDFVNMMIMFNSMRDMLDQQRELARQLNASFDQRISQMHGMVREQLATLDSLRRAEVELRKRLDELEESLVELDTPILTRPPDTGEPRSHAVEHASEQSENETTPQADAQSIDPHPTAQEASSTSSSPLCAVAEPSTETPLNEAPIWAGWELGGDAPDLSGIDVPIEEPIEPADAEAARDAFRALLNLSGSPAGTAASGPLSDTKESNPAQRNNGGIPPLHARVYEYSDAGMPVTQISQELGIGKGEVRLILSLRNDGGA